VAGDELAGRRCGRLDAATPGFSISRLPAAVPASHDRANSWYDGFRGHTVDFPYCPTGSWLAGRDAEQTAARPSMCLDNRGAAHRFDRRLSVAHHLVGPGDGRDRRRAHLWSRYWGAPAKICNRRDMSDDRTRPRRRTICPRDIQLHDTPILGGPPAKHD